MTGRVDILGHIFEKIAQKLKNEVTGRKNKKNIQGCLKSKFNITLSYKIVLFFCSSGFHNLNCNSLPIMSLQTLYCNASRESNPDQCCLLTDNQIRTITELRIHRVRSTGSTLITLVHIEDNARIMTSKSSLPGII